MSEPRGWRRRAGGGVAGRLRWGVLAASPRRRRAAPKVFRIVFPEGFTRAQMVERVDAVGEIARVKRKVAMRMTATGVRGGDSRVADPGAVP